MCKKDGELRKNGKPLHTGKYLRKPRESRQCAGKGEGKSKKAKAIADVVPPTVANAQEMTSDAHHK